MARCIHIPWDKPRPLAVLTSKDKEIEEGTGGSVEIQLHPRFQFPCTVESCCSEEASLLVPVQDLSTNNGLMCANKQKLPGITVANNCAFVNNATR
uniref:Uncharacterized protein n=1 Tax=Steinernema glaseri TaxID=37863 RepID=A0A1I7YVS9_9BILA